VKAEAGAAALPEAGRLEPTSPIRPGVRTRLFVRRLVAVVAIVAFWELVTGGFGLGIVWVNPIILARPSRAIAELFHYADTGLLLTDVQMTFTAAFTGLLIGLIGGTAVGVVFGYWKGLADTLEPIIVALNSLPRIAVAPLLIMWLGLGIPSKVFISLFAVFFVIFFNAFLGTRSVDPDLVRSMQVMGASRAQVARFVVLPSVASWIFAALRTSVSFAFTATITGEFVGSSAGLGYRLVIAAGLLNTNRVFAILFVLMVIGVVLVEITKAVEGWLLRWRPAAILEA
jgi:NitT/TauT family transport system permease protein